MHRLEKPDGYSSRGRCTQYTFLTVLHTFCSHVCFCKTFDPLEYLCDALQHKLLIKYPLLFAKYVPKADIFLWTKRAKRFLLTKPDVHTTRYMV